MNPRNIPTASFTALTLAIAVFLLPAHSRADDTPDTPHTSLASKLKAFQDKFSASAPDEKERAYEAGITSVTESGILDTAKNVGDKAPDFTLQNAVGESVSLSSALKDGPVVLTWYRGGWCPYCSITLTALQEALPDIKAAGGQLIALTPELPDKSLSTTEKHELEYEILTDLNHFVARGYGVVFKLTPEVTELYKQFFDMKEYNGPDAAYNELPLAATYVIGQNGVIQWAFLHADYRKRAEPADIITALKSLKN